MSLVLAAVASSTALTTPATLSLAPSMTDIEIGYLSIISVTQLADRIDITVAYRLTNVGETPIDLDNTDPEIDDNAWIQTYLTTEPDLSGSTRAAGGGVITNPVVLDPGEFFEGVYTANTAQLPDSDQLGSYGWLVVDINGIAGDRTRDNDRAVIEVWPVPSPASSALVLAGLSFVRRKRTTVRQTNHRQM